MIKKRKAPTGSKNGGAPSVGLELVVKSHPADFNATSSQALAKVREQVAGRSDLPVSDVKAALCRPPYGLTESMVMLYVFALIKSGGFELALNPNAGVTLSNGRPLPGDRLTAHTLPLCELLPERMHFVPGASGIQAQSCPQNPCRA